MPASPRSPKLTPGRPAFRPNSRSPGSRSSRGSPSSDAVDPRIAQRQWELEQVRSFGGDALSGLNRLPNQYAPRQTLGVQLGHYALSTGSISSMDTTSPKRGGLSGREVTPPAQMQPYALRVLFQDRAWLPSKCDICKQASPESTWQRYPPARFLLPGTLMQHPLGIR